MVSVPLPTFRNNHEDWLNQVYEWMKAMGFWLPGLSQSTHPGLGHQAFSAVTRVGFLPKRLRRHEKV